MSNKNIPSFFSYFFDYLKPDLKNEKEEVSSLYDVYKKAEKDFKEAEKRYNQRAYGYLYEIKTTNTFKVGDLIKELSVLSKLPKEEVEVYFDTNYEKFGLQTISSLQQMFHAEKDKSKFFAQLVISGDNSKNKNATNFQYTIEMPLDLEKEQADGKTLLEHCKVKFDPEEGTSKFIISKDIDNTYIDIPYAAAMNETNYNNEPEELLQQAMINLYENNKVYNSEDESEM